MLGPLEKRVRSTRTLVWVIGCLLVGTLVLSGAVAILALRPAPVVIVPGVSENRIRVTEEIPDVAVLKFALLYISYLDGYTPGTVEKRSNYILTYVAPEYRHKFARTLSQRAAYVVRTKETSQVTLPIPTLSPTASEVSRLPGGVLRASVVAERRVYIGAELQTVDRLRYLLDVRPALPEDEGAYGFSVVGQTVRPAPSEDAPSKADAP